jgi:Tfp pilus assembly protein PilF
MAESPTPRLPRPTPDQRRAAAAQFDRANQVLVSGDYDYGVQLLLNCCRLDPVNLTFRQALRQAQRARLGNTEKGQRLAALRSLPNRLRLARALRRRDYAEALVQAEHILTRDPWDLRAHLRMAEAFEGAELPDLALLTLDQIRALHPQDPRVNRPLARLCEKRGNFAQAIALWELVRRAVPADLEAQRKAKDLAASATIARGRYEQAVQGTAPTPLVPTEAGVADTQAERAPDAPTAPALPALPSTGEARAPKELTALQARVQNQPTNPLGYLQLAAYYRRLDQLDAARATLTGGLGPTANNFDLGMELLDLEIEPFRRDLAVAEERLQRAPGDAGLQEVRARLAREVSTRELDYFRRRADRSPTDVAARFEMSLRLIRTGQVDEAIRELQAARADPRYHGKALFYLGFCFRSRNNWRLAQRNFQDALAHLGADEQMLRKETLYQLAVGSADAGDLPRAVDHGCELANVDFGYKNISRLLDEWQAKVAR